MGGGEERAASELGPAVCLVSPGQLRLAPKGKAVDYMGWKDLMSGRTY